MSRMQILNSVTAVGFSAPFGIAGKLYNTLTHTYLKHDTNETQSGKRRRTSRGLNWASAGGGKDVRLVYRICSYSGRHYEAIDVQTIKHVVNNPRTDSFSHICDALIYYVVTTAICAVIRTTIAELSQPS
jgi:hypothetical protein